MKPFTRRQFMQTLGAAGLCLAANPVSMSAENANPPGGKKPNVLFIVVDDLRPELACYGQTQVKSPNIDRIAKEGVVFTSAFCNIPVCGASRASVLTGVRPTRNRFTQFNSWADKDLPGHLSLPRYLKENGYATLSLGKVYHNPPDDAKGWTVEPWLANKGKLRGYITEAAHKAFTEVGQGKTKTLVGPAWEIADCADNDYDDGSVTDKAIEHLGALSQKQQPFFLACGFLKPHLPFNAPKKYWDLYEHDKIQLADNPYRPKNAPAVAIHNSPELRRQYCGVPEQTPLPDDYARWLIHGYHACVSYIDAQIGRLMDELKRLKLADNTIIAIWGDHGWNLGEHTMWVKHCNFQTSLRAVLIMKVPGSQSGAKTDALVEFVDIYPSVAELCGLPIPQHCQGTSVVPLLKKPDQPWKKAVFSRWINGDTIRTARYQYTEWRKSNEGPVTDRMLYDHRTDPGENVNVAEEQTYAAAVDELSGMMKEFLSNQK